MVEQARFGERLEVEVHIEPDVELLSDESLDKLILRLDDTQFMRVHRSAIVNLKFLQELQQEGDRKYVARLSSAPEARVPISRDKLDELRERLGIALRG